MVATGKAEAVREWASGWPELDGFLKVNALVAEDGDAAFYPDPAEDDVVTSYIDGTADREYRMNLRLMLRWSDGFDPVNESSDRFASSWLDWVSAQYAAGNVPNWPGCEITAIKPASAPELIFVYQEDGLAEYRFGVVIEYTE